MIKQVILGFMAGVDRIIGDRWYFRFHSKEMLRYWGPWLRRYETYRAYDPPPEAKRFGALDGRLVEMWFDSVEADREARCISNLERTPGTPSPWPRPRSATILVPAVPTEDFLGKEPLPEEKTILRWCCIFKYPDGVSLEEGEKWYLEVHSQEVKQQPGLLKYISHRGLKEQLPPNPWHRISELWYENISAWRKAVIDSGLHYTPPPWGKKEPFVDMVSTFVGYKPDVDFLRDNPTIP
jgi:hypothetical protein